MFEHLESRTLLSVSLGLTATNMRPRIATLTASPNPVRKGSMLALVAGGVADADGKVAKVEFYRDANGDGLFQKNIDKQVGLDGSPRKGWSTYIDTSVLAAGNYTYFARSRDNLGEVSKPAVARSTVTLTTSYIGVWRGTATFTKGDTGTTPLTMNVTSQIRQAYFSGTFTQLDTFNFLATIGKKNRFTMTFSKGTTGTASGTIDLTTMSLRGSFDVTNADGRFAGSFVLTKV
jgi:hypothetical protein